MDIKIFKDAYKGKRCFILGNGCSLLQHDLLKLKNEFTFVCNMFPLHPQFGDICPTFYCFEDVWDFWEYGEMGPKMYNILNTTSIQTNKFFPMNSHKDRISGMFIGHNVYYLNIVGAAMWAGGKLQLDVAKGITVGGSILVDFCLPLAFYMGFSPIYLLGCDFNYVVEGEYQLNHFLGPMKKANWLPSSLEDWYYVQVWRTMETLRVIKESFEVEGRQIYNAGVGGRLELFERKNYNDLF